MRNIKLWRVEFTPKCGMEGCVKVAADKIMDAVELAFEAANRHPNFCATSINPVLDNEGHEVFVLWEDTPSAAVAPSETVVEHEGKQYAAGVKMPTMKMVQDSPDETTPHESPENEAEKQGRDAVEQARREMIQMGKDGKLDPEKNYEKTPKF